MLLSKKGEGQIENRKAGTVQSTAKVAVSENDHR